MQGNEKQKQRNELKNPKETKTLHQHNNNNYATSHTQYSKIRKQLKISQQQHPTISKLYWNPCRNQSCNPTIHTIVKKILNKRKKLKFKKQLRMYTHWERCYQIPITAQNSVLSPFCKISFKFLFYLVSEHCMTAMRFEHTPLCMHQR